MNETNTQTTTVAASTVSTTKSEKIVLGEFSGRYKDVCKELFGDSKRLFGFSDVQAHAVCVRLACDLGRLNSGEAKVQYGKSLNADKMRTVKEVASLKMQETPSITVAFLCNSVDALRKQGLVVEKGSLSLTEPNLEKINEWAVKLKEQIAAQDSK
jgi:hypothetical protein